MAAISITAANVLPGASANLTQGVALAAITMGQAVYTDGAGSYGLADANGSTPANSFAGIAVTTCSAAGQPILVNTLDSAFIFGATILAGDTVWLHTTPGALTKTESDLTSGCTKIVVGNMTTTTALNLLPNTGGAIA